MAVDAVSDMYDTVECLITRSACWMKNLVKAPISFDKEMIQNDHKSILPE